METVFVFFTLLMSAASQQLRCRCCKMIDRLEEKLDNITALAVMVDRLEEKLDNITALLTASKLNPPSSCQELYQKSPSLKSQVYTLKFDTQEIPVYCHMGDFGCGDGGWTLAMKIDGTKSTFKYDSSLWSNKETYNLADGQTGFDRQETKLPTYWNTTFSKICLGMETDKGRNFILIDKAANSLYSLIADGQYRATSLGRDTWKDLLGSDGSLQPNCNQEGFNPQATRKEWSKARIGIINNQENECATCDSRIGFGTGGHPDDTNTCGNEATHGGDNGDKHIKAMGYILVQ